MTTIHNIDGLDVEESTRSGAGYKSVALIKSWGWDRNDVDAKPFQAFLAMSKVPAHMLDKLNAKKSWCVQLGYYSDSRVAAWVAAYAAFDPDWWIENHQGNVTYEGPIPAAVFDMPEFMTAKQAVHNILKKMGHVKPVYVDTDKLVSSDRNRLKSVYGEDIFRSLAKTYGRETVLRDINNLYDDEFINRYKLGANS